jgi:hypothetical protein
MESLLENIMNPIALGSIAFLIMLRMFTGKFTWAKDEKQRRRQEHGAIMAVLIVIMYSLLVIIDKL